MVDHADDCMITTTGICTCTRGIGQPAAALTRKRLVEEYQAGLTQGLEQGRQEGYLEGRREGREEGYAEGRDKAIAEMTEAMDRANRLAQTPTSERPEFIEQAGTRAQDAWDALHQKTEPVPVVKPQSAFDQILNGPEGALNVSQVVGRMQPAPTKHVNHLPATWWWLALAIALGAGAIAWFGTTLLDWGYPFLWAVGASIVVFCSIIIRLDMDARKRL
jgi:hypothetical protein